MIELKVFSETYIDKLHRELIQTGNYDNYLKDEFPFEENSRKEVRGFS